MILVSALLSLFCMLICAWSAWLNYQADSKTWMWIAIALTIWNGLSFASAAAALIQ